MATMPSTRGSIAALLGLAFCAWAPEIPAASGAPPIRTGLSESVLVERGQVPVELRGSCDALRDLLDDPDSESREARLGRLVDVRLDGRPARVQAIEERPRGSGILHVLAIDTSQLNMWLWMAPHQSASASRRIGLDVARGFALRYLDEIAFRDRDAKVMVVTFGDDLRLVAGPTSDREELRRGIEGFPVGYDSRTYDGLYPLLRYLEPRYEKKVVVLVTGMGDAHLPDHFGSSYHRADEIRGLVAKRGEGDLVLFHLDLRFPPELAGSSAMREIPGGEPIRLDGPTGDTGGISFRIERVGEVGAALRAIREALDRRTLLLTYAPQPGASGPEQDRERWKRIRVKSLLPGCKVRTLRREVLGSGSSGVESDVERVADQTVERTAAGGGLAEAMRVAKVYRGTAEALRQRFARWDPSCQLPASQERDEAVPRISLGEFLVARPGSLVVCTADSLVENGIFAAARSAGGGEDPETDAGRNVLMARTRLATIGFRPAPTTGIRRVEMEVPDLATVRAEIRRPEDILLRWMREGRFAREGDDGTDPGPRFLTGGKQLELGAHLTRALFDFYPDYRDWVLEKVRAEMDPEERAQAAAIEDEGMRRAFLSGLARASLHRRIGTWLGDVPLRDALLAVERRVADALLREAGQAGGPAQDDARAVLASWKAVATRFGWPERWRIVAPLLPAYDPARDEIGFYRLLLPNPAWMYLRSGEAGLSPLIEALPDDSIPDEPAALLLVMRMLEDRPAADLLRGTASIASVRHDRLRRGAWRVTLEIAVEDPGGAHGAGERLTIAAEGSRGSSGKPRLLSLAAAPGGPETSALVRGLNARFDALGNATFGEALLLPRAPDAPLAVAAGSPAKEKADGARGALADAYLIPGLALEKLSRSGSPAP